MSAAPITGALDPAAAAELAQHYKQLWTDYKLAVTGLYFCGQPLAGPGPGGAQVRAGQDWPARQASQRSWPRGLGLAR